MGFLTRTVLGVLAGVMLLLAAPGGVAAESVPEAERLNAEGTQHYKARRFQDALGAFRRAHEIDPAPVFLYNIGRCLEHLGRLHEAIDTFEDYLEKEPDAEVRDAVLGTIAHLVEKASKTATRFHIATSPRGAEILLDDDETPLGLTPLRIWIDHGTHRLRLRLPGYAPADVTLDLVAGGRDEYLHTFTTRAGRLEVVGAPAGSSVLLDGDLLGKAPLANPIEVPPGAHRLTVEMDGLSFEQSVDIVAGEKLSVSVTPLSSVTAPPVAVETGDDDGFRYPWYAWATTGLTAAGIGVGTAFMILGAQSGAEAQDYARGASKEDYDRWRSARDEAETDLIIGAVGFGLAGAAAIATGVILGLENADGDEPEEPSAVVLPFDQGAGLSMHLRF